MRYPYKKTYRKGDRKLARLALVFGHPARLAIVRKLMEEGDCFCGDIVKILPLAQATVSQHIRALREAGVIEGRACGPNVCYCLKRKIVDDYLESLTHFCKDGE